MTDRTTIATDGTRVDIAPHTRGISLTVRLPLGTSHPTCHSILETTALLTAIDAADPDAMRAYLRETAPEVITDLYRPEIPEADSPEDIDERVPPREALLTNAQQRRLYLIEQLTKTLPADEAPALAHWIITGGMDQIEDLTLSGEDLNR